MPEQTAPEDWNRVFGLMSFTELFAEMRLSRCTQIAE
jgi:hypothetical protein